MKNVRISNALDIPKEKSHPQEKIGAWEPKPLENPVYITRPFLPPLTEFQVYLEDIWKTRCITNNGKYHQELERSLAEYLKVKYISLFSNGTLALLTALQVSRVTGEVITTPFSFVATTHALWWNNIKPVFVDIEPLTFNIDPEKIESAITQKTTAILPVHVYGNPCDVERIGEIADTYGLKIIYDACHTFGVSLNDKPILNFGDLSVLSFHGTKIYTTFEGGAIVCHDEATKKRIDFLKNFGFAGETKVVAPGINAKMNEFQAALGLLQLRYIDQAITARKRIVLKYREQLERVPGISYLDDITGVNHCYQYFPIIVDGDEYGRSRDELYELLKQFNIFTRRYFYPLISQFPAYRGLSSSQPTNLPTAESICKKILCLPVYPEFTAEEQSRVIEAIHFISRS